MKTVYIVAVEKLLKLFRIRGSGYCNAVTMNVDLILIKSLQYFSSWLPIKIVCLVFLFYVVF